MSASVPDGWRLVEFDSFTTLQRGKDLTKAEFRDGTVPVAGSNGVIGYHDTAIAIAPGITVGRSGSAGKVTVYEEDFWPHNTSLYVRDFHGNDPYFAGFLLGSLNLSRFKTGASVPTLDRNSFKTLPILAPPLPEQKKIAHILSTVQRAIEAQERIIQTTTELKKALMHRLFTEGLRGETQKETEIGPIPESWKQTTLAELCEKPDGALQTGPFGSQLHKNEYQEEGIAVVNPTHLAGNRINHENVPRVSEAVAQRLGKHRLRKFDILFARRGEIGRQGLVSDAEETWLCGTGCFLVRASKPFVDNRFLALYFATDRIVKWLYSHAAGAIMPNLNNAVMQRLPVFYPDLETQSKIIETFTTIDQKLSAAVQRETALQGLFRTLLHELMTAKTRVHTIILPSFT